VPLTTFSGTGLAGIETSVMRGTGWVKSAENQGRGVLESGAIRPS
jgi:hypothetical protein